MTLRRVLRGCLPALILPTLVVVPVGGCRWYIDHEGRKQRDAVIARIETADPRWRWEDIEADRPAVPDRENSVRVVEEFNRWVGDRHFQPTDPDTHSPITTEESPNRLLNAKQLGEIDQKLEGTEPARHFIDLLSLRPRGRVELVPTDGWTKVGVPREQDAYRLVDFLKCESERIIHTGSCTGHDRLIRAQLYLSRIEGAGRFDLKYSYRMSESVCAVRRLERSLATNTFDGRLEDYQREFQRQADTDTIRPAVRRVRADLDWLFRAIESGEASLNYQLHAHDGGKLTVREVGRTWLYRPHMSADWASALDVATAALALADAPESNWLSAWMAIPRPPADDRHPSSTACARMTEELLRQVLVTRALLRCSVAALAVERYRIQTGEWPTHLNEIHKAILTEVPADPFTGNALRFVRRKDGVTIYSVGLDGFDDGGIPADDRAWLHRNRATGDVVFRLYDPAHRRLPALPPEAVNGP